MSYHRRPQYEIGLEKPLTKLWEVSGHACSKRLKPMIPELIHRLKAFDEIKLYGEQEKKLCQMSTWSIDNLLTAQKEKERGDSLCGTKRSPYLKNLIPIRTDFGDIKEPGHLEIDCVLHCGESLSGIYAETLNMFDIETHWSEKRIFLKKTNVKVVGAIHDSRRDFPFEIQSIDFDNGSEFVNYHMHGYCEREQIQFTRSRPYMKNDQAHIEGKNYQTVRRVIGYDRITDEKIVDLVSDIYQNEHRLLTNFFYPTLKLKSKERIDGKTKKKYHTAMTPYQRLMESLVISTKKKQGLREQYERLNPAELQKGLQAKLGQLKKMISVTVTNLATTPR
jgi:hypothetical protein